MLLPGKIKINKVKKAIPSYLNQTIDSNNFESQGCKGLSRGNWPEIIYLRICVSMFSKKDNIIREKGMAYLKKAQWQSMKQLLMSTFRMTKTARLLEIKTVSG